MLVRNIIRPRLIRSDVKINKTVKRVKRGGLQNYANQGSPIWVASKSLTSIKGYSADHVVKSECSYSHG